MRQKLLTLLLLSFWFIPMEVFGQNGIYIGPQAGVNLSSTFFQNTSELFRNFPEKEGSGIAYLPTIGYTARVNFGIPLSNHWSVQLGLGYTQGGQKYEDTYQLLDGPLNVQWNVRLGYLQFPLLARYSSHSFGDNVSFSMSFGPTIGIMVQGSDEAIFNGVPDSMLADPFIKYNTLDLGLEINPGVDIYFSKTTFLTVAFHAYVGLVNLNGAYYEQYIPEGQDGLKSQRNLFMGLHVGFNWIIEQRYRNRWH